MELITVNVTIADRTYRLKLNSKDEEAVRKTVKLVNEKIVEFKTNLAGKDMQDYVSMVLLWFASQQRSVNAPVFQEKETQEQLNSIEQLLNKILKEE